MYKGILMLVEDAIYRRHSTTEFTDKIVLHSLLNSIINKSLSVPHFNQRFNFNIVVIHQKESKKIKIVKALKRYGESKNDFKALNEAESIDTASVLLLLYKDKSNYHHDKDLLTLGALGENICLLATNHFLGTLWLDKLTCIEKSINTITNTKNKELCYGIALGYRNRLYSYQRDGAISSNGIVRWL